MLFSATAALGALSLHPAPLLQGSDFQRRAGWGGWGGTGRLWHYCFLPFRKMLGRKEANSSLCCHSCLAERKLRKRFGQENLCVNWVLPLRRRAGDMRGSGNFCPASGQKGMAFTCCEVLVSVNPMPLHTDPASFLFCGKRHRFKQQRAKRPL